MNTDVDTWGEDSHEFRPERWLPGGSLPNGVREMPSLAFPTFLAGARGCIGFRFTMVECVSLSLLPRLITTTNAYSLLFRMKIILFSLVRTVNFKLAVPVEDVVPKTL